MFIAALFTKAKKVETTQCPSTDEQINTMWFVHTIEYYLAIKRKEILTCTTTWMDPENTVLSKRSPTQKVPIV